MAIPDSLHDIDNIMYADIHQEKYCRTFLRFLIKVKEKALTKCMSQEKAEQAMNMFLCSNKTANSGSSHYIPDHYGLAYTNSTNGRKIDIISYIGRLKTLSGYWQTQLSRVSTVYPHFCGCYSAHWQNILK